MLSLNKFFNDTGLEAFTTDHRVDYTLNEASPFLTGGQKAVVTAMLNGAYQRLAWVKQVHGAEVAVVDEDFINDTNLKEADALVTDQKHVLIAVRTADCLPVFIWDAAHQAMGIAHAGWKSTHKQIVRRTLEVMAERYSTARKDVLIAFGPAIRSCCYQVSGEFARYFPNDVLKRDGQLYMDLIKANRDQLMESGVMRDQIFDSRVCTVCSPGWFSYRRDGEKAGRMFSGLMLKG